MFSSDSFGQVYKPLDEAAAEIPALKEAVMKQMSGGQGVVSPQLTARVEHLASLMKAGHKSLAQIARDYRLMLIHAGVNIGEVFLQDPLLGRKIREAEHLMVVVRGVFAESKVIGDTMVYKGTPIGYFLPGTSNVSLDVPNFVHEVCGAQGTKVDTKMKDRIEWILRVLDLVLPDSETRVLRTRGARHQSWIIPTEKRKTIYIVAVINRRFEQLLLKTAGGRVSSTPASTATTTTQNPQADEIAEEDLGDLINIDPEQEV